MRTRQLTLLFVFFNFGFIFCQDSPLSVLVIGGGPAGLGAAIEAKSHGCSVTILEKREKYSRPQYLFLDDRAIGLLKEWGVATDEIGCSDIGNEEHVWFIRIHRLEELLSQRVSSLGIQTVRAEFQSLSPDHSAMAVQDGHFYTIPYDILIGADGAHSIVREALSIDSDILGSAFGASSIEVHGSKENPVSLPDPIPLESGFINQVRIPFVNIVVMQASCPFSLEEFRQKIEDFGWAEDLAAFDERRSLVISDIPILLQKAKSFFNAPLMGIIIGDAAATASFFQGEGASVALYTAKLAGQLCKKIQDSSLVFGKTTFFQEFEQCMKKETEFLIEDSAFLFNTGLQK